MDSRLNHRWVSDRRENYPDGFVEDCATAPQSNLFVDPGTETKIPAGAPNFIPGSLILSLQKSILLNAENNYRIQFQTGILEGSGLSINTTGGEIKFHEDGSYRFEICGEATPFSEVAVQLIYHNETFTDDVKIFSQTEVPLENGKLQLRGLATILPIHKGQVIEIRLVPTPAETILVLAHTRLMIHRVA